MVSFCSYGVGKGSTNAVMFFIPVSSPSAEAAIIYKFLWTLLGWTGDKLFFQEVRSTRNAWASWHLRLCGGFCHVLASNPLFSLLSNYFSLQGTMLVHLTGICLLFLTVPSLFPGYFSTQKLRFLHRHIFSPTVLIRYFLFSTFCLTLVSSITTHWRTLVGLQLYFSVWMKVFSS